MRIVLVTHFYPAHGGGVEMVARQLAARMAAQGHELVWCASDTDTAPSLPGVSCDPMRSFNAIERLSGVPYPLWSPASFARLARHIRAADAVHVHDAIYASSLAAATLARYCGKRLVVTQHIGQVPMPALLRPVLGAANRLGARAVLTRADAVAFISPAVHQYFKTLTGPRPGFHDVPNGVDHEVFSAVDDAPGTLRAALGFDAGRPLMLFVGRFVGVKRLPLVREMAAARPDWQWCVIGQGPEDPAAWGLPNVRAPGPMPQASLVNYYRAADLLVLPSRSEGFPLVVQESMACGLPACFTARVSTGSKLPSDLWLELPESPGETGRLGVQAIADWLSRPVAQRQAQRNACAHFARQAWSWDTCTRLHTAWLSGQPA